MLQQWLRDRCVPAVATLVTEDADLICRKNNVNFEQLVRYIYTSMHTLSLLQYVYVYIRRLTLNINARYIITGIYLVHISTLRRRYFLVVCTLFHLTASFFCCCLCAC